MLFGQSRDPERYNHVLTACALDPDIDVLPAGDLTEIGEKVRSVSNLISDYVIRCHAFFSVFTRKLNSRYSNLLNYLILL